MMKLLIVDDETILREGIYRVGKWDQYGIKVTGRVSNGLEALKSIQKEIPDIILTDVVMPVMNGIEFSAKIHELYPSIRIIMLSGHEEFAYVKKAMEYKVSLYLIKPATIEKIREAVLDLKDEIEDERRQEEEQNRLHAKMRESIPLLKEHYLNQLVINGPGGEKEFIEQRNFLGLNIEPRRLCLMVFELDEQNEGSKNLLEWSYLRIELRRVSQEIMEKEFYCDIFQNAENQMVILMNVDGSSSLHESYHYAAGKARRIQREIESLYACTVSVGIARPFEGIKDIKYAYMKGKMALAHTFFMGASSIIYIGDIEGEAEENPYALIQLETELLPHLKAGNKDQTLFLLETYFTELSQYATKGSAYIKEALTVLAYAILRSFAGGDRETKEIEGGIHQLLDVLREDAIVSFQELQNIFTNYIGRLTDVIGTERELRNQGIIDLAKSYIKDNLDQDVSLMAVAECVFISPNYLSYLFKESGENFKDYVIRVKMEEATKLLKEKSLNKNQIAHRLGYSDGRYFTQVYKKYCEKQGRTTS